MLVFFLSQINKLKKKRVNKLLSSVTKKYIQKGFLFPKMGNKIEDLLAVQVAFILVYISVCQFSLSLSLDHSVIFSLSDSNPWIRLQLFFLAFFNYRYIFSWIRRNLELNHCSSIYYLLQWVSFSFIFMLCVCIYIAKRNKVGEYFDVWRKRRLFKV